MKPRRELQGKQGWLAIDDAADEVAPIADGLLGLSDDERPALVGVVRHTLQVIDTIGGGADETLDKGVDILPLLAEHTLPACLADLELWVG